MHFTKLSWIVVAVATVAGTYVATAAEPSNSVANGKRIYLTVGCFECHGRVGQGGAFNGYAPALAGFLSGKTALDVISAVRKGPNDMPAYTDKVLSNAELADVVAYVRSLPGPANPKNYPILDK